MSGVRRRPIAGRLFRNVVIPVGIAVLLVAFIEGAFRITGRVRTGTWPVTRAESATRFAETVGRGYESHPFLLVRGRPGAAIDVAGHSARFDANGYRGSTVVMPKPPGRYRIVCSGGSTTFDLLALDDESTWPARLDLLLEEDVDIVNAGFPGWTTVENLISLQLRDVDLAPDLVIVFAGINDLQPASHQPFRRDYTLGHAELLPRVLGVDPIPLRLPSRLIAVEWLRDRLAPGREPAGGWMPAWEWEGGERQEMIPDVAVEVFARNLRSIAGVARAHDARVLFVAQHVAFDGSAADRDYLESWAPGLTAEGFVRSLERLNEAARDLAAQGLADFVDPFETGEFAREDFGDPMHFTASGSEKFAHILAERVRSRVETDE